MTADELALLRESTRESPVVVVCTRVHYSCCGRGFHERAGYEQVYRGEAKLTADSDEFLLYSYGVGTVSYICAIRFDDVELVEVAHD